MTTARTLPVPTTGEGRLIEHFGDSVVQSTLRERVGRSEFYRAVGYLSTWNMTYPHVKLYYNPKEMVASACAGRAGVFAPDSGATAIRDERGLIVAVTRLVAA